MGKMATFFASVFSGLFTLFSSWVGKKIAFGGAVTATLLAVTVAFYLAINGLLATVMVLIPNQTLLMMFHSLLPSNFATCMTAVLTTDVAAFLYSHQLMTIKAVTSAN